MADLTARRLLALLVVIFVGLGVAYGLATPCFESPDESSHLTVIRYMAINRSLPPYVVPVSHVPSGSGVARYLEYHDPPLYYTPPLYHGLAALLVSWVDMGDLPSLLVPSPNWEMGWGPQRNDELWNKNVYVHRAQETLSRSGTVQATYILRLVSVGLGAVTVLCAYALAHLLWPGRPALALGAAACVAFNPQFIAISAGVTNDNLLNALFSLCLVGSLRLMREGASWSRWATLGGLVGLGLLTKQSALLLLPVGCLAIIWKRGLPFVRRTVLADGVAFLATACAVGGWWYARNAILYADPLGLAPHFEHQTPLTHFSLDAALTAARSYWAAFGWALIQVEPVVYWVVGLVVLAGLAGIAATLRPDGPFWRAPAMTRRGVVLLTGAVGLNLVGFVRWAVATGAPYGRLLFPTLAATGVLMAWGLSQWTRWRVGRWVLWATAGLGLLFAALVPWRYLRPVYATPRLPDGTPDVAQAVDLSFQGDVQLVGYEANTESLEPNQEFRLTLYWHAPDALQRRYRVWVQLGPRDPAGKVAECEDWLGGTLYPGEWWQAGDTVRQIYRLSIPEWASAPHLYWIRTGLVDETGARVALADGSSDQVVLGPWRMRSISAPASPSHAADFHLGPTIRLLGYDLEQRQEAEGTILDLSLHWQAAQVPEMDYTVYVHLMDEEGQLLAQHDAPPRDGTYPSSWWLPGQVVVDRHTIHLDGAYAGSARLLVGMYDPATLTRLPAYDGAGQRLPDDTIPLAQIAHQTSSWTPELIRAIGAPFNNTPYRSPELVRAIGVPPNNAPYRSPELVRAIGGTPNDTRYRSLEVVRAINEDPNKLGTPISEANDYTGFPGSWKVTQANRLLVIVYPGSSS